MNPKDNIEKLISEKNVQFRDFRLTNIEQRANEEGAPEMVVEGVAATFNQPTVLFKADGIEYKEQIDPDAFSSAEMDDVIFNINHCGRVYARTRNNSLQLTIEEDGLHMRAQLLPEDEGHKQLFRDIQSGLLDKMSFAFTVAEDKYDQNERMRTITKIDRLFDVSVVDIPAYDSTSISARNYFDAVRSEELEEIQKREKKAAIDAAINKYWEVREKWLKK